MYTLDAIPASVFAALPLPQVEIVEELLAYLAVADFAMREELVLKAAVLAERWVLAVCLVPH